MFKKIIITLAVLALLPVLSSCLDETVKPIKEAPPATWPEMTSEDDAIQAIVMCYGAPGGEETMSKYDALLHSEYFFELAPDDVDVGKTPVITRAEDITLTGKLFMHQTDLELEILMSGAWNDCPEVAGTTCEGCRETTRSYFIRVQFDYFGKTYMCEPDSYVTIIVAPDESDPAKWVIRAIYDHGS